MLSLAERKFYLCCGRGDLRQLYSCCVALAGSDCKSVGRRTLSVLVSCQSRVVFFKVQPRFSSVSQGTSLADSVFPLLSAVGLQQLFPDFSPYGFALLFHTKSRCCSTLNVTATVIEK